MSKLLDPITLEDFSRGRITKYSVSPLLAPLNSVANAINLDFSEIIGSPIVRKGNRMRAKIAYNGKVSISQTTQNNSSDVYDTTWMAQTFTVVAGETVQIGVVIRASKTGAPEDLTVQLRNTVAGAPGATILATATIPKALITGVGNEKTAVFLPAATLVAGTVYAIVVSSPTSPNVGNSYQIYMNTAGGYAGGNAQSSTNSGSTWAAFGGGLYDFYFKTYVQDTSGDYNTRPLGFQAGTIGATPSDYGVVVYTTEVNGVTVLFYMQTPGVWLVSNLQNLSSGQMERFAILKGAIFRAGLGRPMDYSTDLGATWQPGSTNNITITENSVVPNLLWVSKNRMLASGHVTFPSRIYFSSIVDPNAASFITWDTDPSTGDWIDINPDDGGNITGFSDTSNLVLIFKNNAMYRLNTINKTVDSENIFNVGAVSQEAITKCLGLTYFYSGNGIYRTDGGFPEMISRLAVQDFIDNIVSAGTITAGNDGLNVWFSLGDVTLRIDDNVKRTFQRVVLKFSPRDESWSVFTFNYRLSLFSTYKPGQTATEFWNAQYNGDIGQLNWQGLGNQDNGDYSEAINYELETQELDMGNRSHTKIISDKIVVFTKAGTEGSFQIRGNDNDFDPVDMSLNDRVNVGDKVNVAGQYFTFKWLGEIRGARPILQGILLPVVTDEGITKK